MLKSPPASSAGRRRIMQSIRSSDTQPERLLRSALRQVGCPGYRLNWHGPGGRIDIAFVGKKVAVFVDGAFWHGHPSKWTPGRWSGYWDQKIRRNIERDRGQTAALKAAGWIVLRYWEFEVHCNPSEVADAVRGVLATRR